MPRPSVRDIAAGRTVKGPVRERHEADPGIIIATIALAATGVLMIYSAGAASLASDPADMSTAIVPELIWVTLGIVVMLVLSRMDYRWLRLISVALFLTALALLVIVLGPAIGPIAPKEVGGASRWLIVGPAAIRSSFHPAEIAKLALVIYLAHWLARRGTSIGGLFRGTLPFLCIAGCVIALVALEPDLGTTGVITLAAFTMFFVAGASLWQLAADRPDGHRGRVDVHQCLELPARPLEHVPGPLDGAAGDRPTRPSRACWPWRSGGTLGQGLGHSRQPGGLLLPNAENDFVFAMVGQELGLVGATLVMGMFLFLAWRGIRVALDAPDTFGALLAVGITALITFQAFINIGVVVHLLPLTGITLPFVSSGNSSLLVSFAAVGILLSISRETQSRGTADDADPGRGRRYRRTHLSGDGRPAAADPAPAGP